MKTGGKLKMFFFLTGRNGNTKRENRDNKPKNKACIIKSRGEQKRKNKNFSGA